MTLRFVSPPREVIDYTIFTAFLDIRTTLLVNGHRGGT
jgi:hypothetical protein